MVEPFNNDMKKNVFSCVLLCTVHAVQYPLGIEDNGDVYMDKNDWNQSDSFSSLETTKTNRRVKRVTSSIYAVCSL